MYGFTPKTIPHAYQRVTWWDKHPDKCSNDFDQNKPAYRGEPMSPEEEAAFYDEQETLTNPIY